MFHRTAAKGPGLLLGLCAVLLPASQTFAKLVPPARAAVSGFARPVSPKATSKVIPKPVAKKPAAKPAKPAGPDFKALMEEFRGRGAYSALKKRLPPRVHGGGKFDFNLDADEGQVENDPDVRFSNEIEPYFMPDGLSYVLST